GSETTRGDRVALDRPKLTAWFDAQHRDLIAPSVNGKQIPPVAASLQRALGTDAGSGSGTTRRKRGTVQRRQRAVCVLVKGGDRVSTSGVVVYVQMSDHIGRGSGASGRIRGPCSDQCVQPAGCSDT